MLSQKNYTINIKLEHMYIVHLFRMTVFVLLFSSCEQNVNIEIKTNDKRLLVDGEFTTDLVIHTIKLYRSGSLITGQHQTVVTGAKIYVTDNIETFYYIENKDTLGLYQTAGKVGGTGGHVYTLSITNIDIDNDGTMDSYTANSLMPKPLSFDSLVSSRGLDGDGDVGVNNMAYFKLFYNGPDFIYKFLLLNNESIGTITDRLGEGTLTRDIKELMVPKVLSPGSFINSRKYLSTHSTVVKGDTITFICFNFTNDQYSFLKIFDSNTSSKDQFTSKNLYDQLIVPTNLPTNIEPADRVAGYFFVYSISKISKVFNQ